MNTENNPHNIEWIDHNLYAWLNSFPKLGAKRLNWNEFFMTVAFIVSQRSPCLRAKCGAVIVKNKTIIATGYNGTPHGQKNCLEIGNCYRNDHNIKSGTQLELCRAVGCHGEANAVTLSARNGQSTNGCDMYVYGNSYICNQCKGIIMNAGITTVYYIKKDSNILNTIDVQKEWKIHPIDK